MILLRRDLAQTTQERRVIWALLIGLILMPMGCTRDDATSASAVRTYSVSEHQSELPSLLLGRVTSITTILSTPDQLALGHENGALSLWPKVTLSDPRAEEPLQSWIAHEGVIRTLDFNKDQREIISLGADGSWARWSLDARLIKRYRATDVYANRVISDLRGGWLIAGARGVVARWRDQKRVWISAGEHGRAAFDIELLDTQRAISIGSDGWVRCWLIETGGSCGELPLHQGWATSLHPVRSGEAPPNSEPLNDVKWWLSAGSDGFIKVWGTAQLNTLLTASLKHVQQTPLQGRRLDEPPSAHALHRAHDKDITRLSYHAGLILSGSEDGSVTLLKLKSSGLLQPQWTVRSPVIKPVLSLIIDQQGKRALIGGGSRAGSIWSVALDLHQHKDAQPQKDQAKERVRDQSRDQHPEIKRLF